VIFDSSIDKNRDAVDGAGALIPINCREIPRKDAHLFFPQLHPCQHDFRSHKEKWAVVPHGPDKHPAYDFVNGPSGTGVTTYLHPKSVLSWPEKH